MLHVRVRLMITGLVIVAGLYVAAIGFLYTLQRSLMYFPDTRRMTPAAANFDAEEIKFTTSDGETVLAWWHAPAANRPIIVHFHGNGGSLAWRTGRYRLFTTKGYGLLAMTYRGYSGSTGKPSETAAIQDAALSFDFLEERGYSPTQIVLYGESLGTGIAVQLAAQTDVLALVLESPYPSTWAVAKSLYPIFPVRLLMKDKFESFRFIDRITSPLLVIHGRNDNVIPFRFGKELFDLAHEPKQFIAIENGGHNDLFANGAGDAVLEFLEGLKTKR